MENNELKEWMRDHVKHIDRERLLPTCHTRGMGDFIADNLDSGDRYMDCYEAVLDSSDLMLGGYLKYDPLKNGSYSGWMCCVEDDYWTYTEAAMEAYDKYLCSDGKIRYVKTKEAESKCDFLYKRNDEEFWNGIDEAFAERGMYYDEERGCYINPETGEEDCY